MTCQFRSWIWCEMPSSNSCFIIRASVNGVFFVPMSCTDKTLPLWPISFLCGWNFCRQNELLRWNYGESACTCCLWYICCLRLTLAFRRSCLSDRCYTFLCHELYAIQSFFALQSYTLRSLIRTNFYNKVHFLHITHSSSECRIADLKSFKQNWTNANENANLPDLSVADYRTSLHCNDKFNIPDTSSLKIRWLKHTELFLSWMIPVEFYLFLIVYFTLFHIY